MTATNYRTLATQLLGIEGGVSDRPLKDDPGGLTNLGVTQATYDQWRTGQGLATQSVRRITPAEALSLYRTNYWDTVRADDLPSGLDFTVFDYSVNSGPGRAVKDLQRALGAKVDGIIGAGTLALIAKADLADLIRDVCDRRLAFMKSLRNWQVNKNGWTARVSHVLTASLNMAMGAHPASPPVALTVAPIAKAPEAAQAQMKTADGAGLSVAGAGAAGQTILNKANDLMPHFGETLLGKLAFVAFALMLVIGGGLVGYSYVKRIKEAGGLGGFVGSVFK